MRVQGQRLDYGSTLSQAAPAGDDAIKIPGWIYQHRWWIFGAVALVYLASFSGEWRIGRDSALYRGLGHTLATGRGFTFSEFGKRQIYPGLPLMLAGLEKMFGASAIPPILVMHLMALGCLITTYKLVSLRYPQWLAVCVTTLLALNGWFLELSNEILTDIPFLFGLLLALYGWERLRIWGVGEVPTGEAQGAIERAQQKHPWVSLIVLLVGLGLAAVMRPTFWIVAIAWAMICLWGLIAGPGRKFYAICLTVLVLVWVAALLADPRVKGFNPLGGGYERDAIHAVQRASVTISRQLPQMLESEFSYAFFGQKWLPGLTEIMCLVVLSASLLLLRTNPLWTLLVVLTVATTLVMTAVPRYYIMVMPILLLGWFVLAGLIAQRVPRHLADWVLAGMIAMVLLPGISRIAKVIGEQRHLNHPASTDEYPKWKYVLDMGDVVRQHVPEGAKVIGPGSTIMSYVSGREVLMQRELLPNSVSPTHYPEHLAAMEIEYAVFPPTLYRKGERVIRDLMERGVIVPVERVGRTQEMVLARVKIEIPQGDWRKRPPVDVMTARGMRLVATTTRPAVVQAKPPPTTSHTRHVVRTKKSQKLAHVQHKLATTRKAKKARRAAAAAATQSISHPTTLPVR